MNLWFSYELNKSQVIEPNKRP
uniref:Uncharacterized protein n=1 Tax=Rhizophora mucronata TaxID=61149 RepID=A0A2P2QPA7_RHIMU